MSNPENKLIDLDISYPYVGGDKSVQGLQEYLASPQFHKHSFVEADSTFLDPQEVNMIGNVTNTSIT